MSSQVIQIGIDLGTTNSEIAANVKGKIEIIKNSEGDEYTPSVFGFDKAKNKVVGKRACEKLFHYATEEEVKNYKAEVKRLMGTSESYHFDRVSKDLNPEEISAEVLIYLKESALKRYPDIETNSVVISIPACFSALEAEATKRAGNLAGFEHVVLIQEPIAAAMAYGFSNTENEHWLVYDLGGGTFDVALISSQDGTLSVKEHNGDNFLGGKDFDLAIVDQVLVPKIKEKYELSGFSRKNEKYRSTFAKLKHIAEQAKKYLSEEEKITIEIDNIVKDENGKEIYLTVDLSRKEFDELIEPMVQKTVKLAKKTIEESGVRSSSVKKIILVGGPTQIPYIRNQLSKKLKMEVDTSVDPLTTVAKGACIFAGSQRIPTDILSKSKKEKDKEKMEIQLHYDPMSSSEEESISGVITALQEEEDDHYLQIQSEGGYYTSTKLKIKNGKFIDTVAMEDGKSNLFWIFLFNSKGKPVSVYPDSFTITHGLSVGGAPIPHSVGVSLAKRDAQKDFCLTEEFFCFFDKGNILPLEKTEQFKTVKNLRKGDKGNVLPIKVYEGESDIPDRNIFICSLNLSGENIPYDLQEGTDIDVTISVSESRGVSVSAFIPSIDLSMPSVRGTIFDEKVDLAKLENDLKGEYERFHEVESSCTSEEKNELKHGLESASHSLKNALSDEDEKRKAHKELKDVQRSLDKLSSQKKMSTLKRDFEQNMEQVNELIDKFIEEADKKRNLGQLSALKKEGERAIRESDKALLVRIIEQLQDLGSHVLLSNPAFWVHRFNQLAEGDQAFIDQEQADYYIKKGKNAINLGEVEELKECVQQLSSLLPEEAQESIGTSISGITHQ